jgi:hypothetical protein
MLQRSPKMTTARQSQPREQHGFDAPSTEELVPYRDATIAHSLYYPATCLHVLGQAKSLTEYAHIFPTMGPQKKMRVRLLYSQARISFSWQLRMTR